MAPLSSSVSSDLTAHDMKSTTSGESVFRQPPSVCSTSTLRSVSGGASSYLSREAPPSEDLETLSLDFRAEIDSRRRYQDKLMQAQSEVEELKAERTRLAHRAEQAEYRLDQLESDLWHARAENETLSGRLESCEENYRALSIASIASQAEIGMLKSALIRAVQSHHRARHTEWSARTGSHGW
jgi:chromosome segregation ATPase